MAPFQVDPSWYEDYWLSERSPCRRWILLASLIEPALRIGRNLWLTRSCSSQHGLGKPQAQHNAQ